MFNRLKKQHVTPSHGVRHPSVRFAETHILDMKGLDAVPFATCINTALKLNPNVFASVAVVTSAMESKVAFLLTEPSVPDHDIHSILEIMSTNGWTLPTDGPQAWRTVSSIIMAVAQGHTSKQTSLPTSNGKGALWQSFVDIIQWSFSNNANDIDFAINSREPMSQVCFKIDGRYVRPQRWLLPTNTMVQMLGTAWQKSGGGNDANFQSRIEQQAQLEITLPNGQLVRLRWSGLACDAGPVVTLRLHKIGDAALVTTLEGAGYLPWHLEVFNRVTHAKGGMTTLAGTVGSGKSLTLAILMSLLPEHFKKISFEDPVELHIEGVYQKSIVRDLLQAGEGADSAFASGVRALFRSAFDILLLGEIRDTETGRVARAVLESGHGLLTSTHAKDSLGVFSKLISPQVGIPVDVLATPGNVRLNTYQALIPKNCPHCSMSPDDYVRAFALSGQELNQHLAYLNRLERLYQIDASLFKYRDHRGCVSCRHAEITALNGFSGRTVVAEMLEPDDAICELLLKGNYVDLSRYWRSLSDGKYDSPDFTGKTAMDVAMFKAAKGLIDPREIEVQFESFEALDYKRAKANIATHASAQLKRPQLAAVANSEGHK